MGVGTTYSFKDVVGVISNPTFGITFPLTGGNIGVGTITVTMAQERTVHDVAADGTVMPSYIAGDNGHCTIECQQTSIMHKLLLNLYNIAVAAANASDVSGWAATRISLKTILDGSSHNMTGVSFAKIPDKSYQAQGQKVTWSLLVANSIQTGSVVQSAITSALSGLGL
jgi:hypothetical protein